MTKPEPAMLLRALNQLCPLHLVLDENGHLVQIGPTFAKLMHPNAIIGAHFSDVLAVRRPRAITDMAELVAAGGKLRLSMRGDPARTLAGEIINAGGDHFVLALSFGIALGEAVRHYGLTASDFARTDLAVEMLYLSEAKTAAMEVSQKMGQRLQGARIAAEAQAMTDPLTGLKNRRALEYAFARLIASGEGFALMNVDLDFFKAVNDQMGHAAGDHVLVEVARIMLEETRESDTVARTGGDEFIILIRNIQDRAILSTIGSRIITRLQQPIPFGGGTCDIAASIGTSLSQDYAAPEAARMIKDADIALYASKTAGRARQTFFVPELSL